MNRYLNAMDEFNTWPWDCLYEDNMSMKTDIIRDGDNLILEIEMPGFNKEDIKITLENGILDVRGTKKQGDGKYVHREIKGGKSVRRFKVSSEFDSDNISAKYENGVLYVYLTKKEEKKTFIHIQ